MDSEEIKHHHHHHHRRHKHHWLRWLWVLIGVAFVIAVIFAAMAWRNLRDATNGMYSSSGVSGRSISSVLKQKKPISILLLGTDTGALGRTEKGRTDTIMMMTINTQTNKTTIVSLPRDMKVDLPDYPDYSPAKINSAYTYGGVKETIKVIKEQFGIPVDAYLLVNMGSMEKAIDQVDGIDVKSPLTFTYEGYSFKKGKTYHMDGKEALAFSRMRYDDPDGDYGRQSRQRLIIVALIKESASYKSVLNRKFLQTLSGGMQTNLTFSNMTQLALNYRDATKVVQDYASGTSDDEDGVSYQQVSYNERQRISNLIRQSLGLQTKTLPDDDDSDSSSY